MRFKEIKIIRGLYLGMLAFVVGLLLSLNSVQAETYIPLESNRSSINFNMEWQYTQGDVAGADNKHYDDTSWKGVSLPHTTKFVSDDDTDAYIGVSWYRKHFTIDSSYEEKKVSIEFEAAMQAADVWINGVWKTRHEGGYLPFSIDITDDVNYGDDNVIAVKVDSSPSSNFAPGKNVNNLDFKYHGGLYRNVKMHITDKLHVTDAVYSNKVAGGGMFITYPTVDEASATVHVQTEVINEYTHPRNCTLITNLVDNNQNLVATASTTESINGGDSVTYNHTMTINQPQLWHPDEPNLYTVHTRVQEGTTIRDHMETRIGIRRIEWTHDNGLQINGSRFYGQGINRHQESYGLGNALPDLAVYNDVKRVKDAGMDYIRTAHYPNGPAFYDACDELGILVMNSLAGWQYYSDSTAFKNNTYQQIRDMIRRDRNHPSVVVWEASLNESHYTDQWAQTANSIAHEEYPGDQMYTAGWKNSVYDIYTGASQHGVRNSQDMRPIIISEYGDWDYGGVNSTSRQTREDGDEAMLTQCDNLQESLNMNRGLSWYSVDGYWDFADYCGYTESSVKCGIVDFYRIPKFSYYFYKSQRDPDIAIEGVDSGPMVYIANTWQPTSPTTVRIYSNCDEVALYKNGTLVATQLPDTNYPNLDHPPFTIDVGNYESGELRAEGIINGVVHATHIRKTPELAESIVLRPEATDPLQADGSDARLIFIDVVDENGTVVPTANNAVALSVTGPGKIVGPTTVNMKGGQLSAWVAAGERGGMITLTATGTGLTSAQVDIPVVNENASFIKGADVSHLLQLEDFGGKFYDDGVEKDCLQILKEHGVNSIRIKVWNDPGNGNYHPANQSDTHGYNNKEHVVELATRAKSMGFKIMIDFHYSDWWADPGKQYMPHAWVGMSLDELKTSLYNFTYDVMDTLKANGVEPEWVQVGNEITNGMMWDVGKTQNWDGLAQLLKQGYGAVKDVSPSSQVILHLDKGGDNAKCRTWYDNALSRGVEWDITALSFYPPWHGSMDELTYNMNDLVARYGKDMMIVETAYPWTNANGDSQRNVYTSTGSEPYPMSPQGQAEFLTELVNRIEQVPDGKGKGFFYWEPEMIPVEGAGWKYGEGDEWDNVTLFDFDGHALSSLDTYLSLGEDNTLVIPDPVNVALGKSISSDSEQSGHMATYAVDGDASTRWCSEDSQVGHWLEIDLGQQYTLSGTKILWEQNNAYQYKLEVSDDSNNWTVVSDKYNNASSANMMTDVFQVDARYVRITITGGLSSSVWGSLYELEVYGEEIIIEQSITSDSEEVGNTADKAIDGDSNTRWCAADGEEDHWLKMDLGEEWTIGSTEIIWEMDHAYQYKIEVSSDDNQWTLAIDKTDNNTSANVMTDSFTANGRYVRITITGGVSSSVWASIYEWHINKTSMPLPTNIEQVF